MSHLYAVYGLTLQTPFACADLSAAETEGVPDIVVTEGFVPESLAAAEAVGPDYECGTGRFLWRGYPRSGRFLVSDGRRIIVERYPDSDESIFLFVLYRYALAAALHQRGLLILHAISAVSRGQAFAVSGPSGAGKSTTMAALLAHGCLMLSDDVTALRLGPDGRIEALPGPSEVRLRDHAVQNLGLRVAERPGRRASKHAVSTASAMAAVPYPLSRLYLLDPCPVDSVSVKELHGTEKFAALLGCLYGLMTIAEHPANFPFFSTLLDQIAVVKITRPIARWSVDAVAAVILDRCA